METPSFRFFYLKIVSVVANFYEVFELGKRGKGSSSLKWPSEAIGAIRLQFGAFLQKLPHRGSVENGNPRRLG